MKYSYIKPRKKTPFTQELQLLITFFSITIVMLIGTYLFLLYQGKNYNEEKIATITQRFELKDEIESMETQIAYIKKQKVLAQKIVTGNSVLKDSITNLFDLVPERITLSEAKLLQNGLILHGVTPNKDVYNFMLQAPLRSIFHKTYSSFYPADNGWLNFVSTNYIEKDEEEFSNEK